MVTLAGLINAELLLALAAMGGTTRAFTVPARNALANALVERRNLAAAIGVNAATYQGTIFIGTAICGGVIFVAGSGAAFLIYGCGIAFAFFMVSILDIASHTRKAGPRDSFFAELGAGFRYAFAHPGIRVMLFLLALMALAVQPYQEMLSGFAADVLGGGPGVYTLMFSAGGLGAMLGGLWIARRGRTQGLSRVMFGHALCALLGLSVFAASPYLPLTLAAAAVTGGGAPALSAILIGALASRLGVQGPLLGAAVAGLVIWLVLARRVLVQAATMEWGGPE